MTSEEEEGRGKSMMAVAFYISARTLGPRRKVLVDKDLEHIKSVNVNLQASTGTPYHSSGSS